MPSRLVILLVALILSAPTLASAEEPPKTIAEAAGFKKTSLYADVMSFCERLAKESPVVRLGELGVSQEGRKLPLLILADPPTSTPEQARASKKLVVFALGNIHAGEVDGKDGLLMLARDIAYAKERPLLKDLIILLAPIFNADGNERLGENRREQAGPREVGVRENAQGLDLNRDFVKLETSEARSLVRFLNEWDPAVFIDCHTTNGSYHRYTMTYEGPDCPADDPRIVDYVREKLLPDAGMRLQKATGFLSYFYGNFSPDRSQWETVPPTPRFVWQYVGLRNRLSILSESYSYASFKDRVLASKGFVQAIFEHAAENRATIQKLLDEARKDVIKAGKAPSEKDAVVIRHKAAPWGRPAGVLGWVEERKNGERVPTNQPKIYECLYMGGSKATETVRRPYAYLISKENVKAVALLQQHGFEIETLNEDVELDVELFRINKVARPHDFQRHLLTTVEGTSRKENKRLKAGTILMRTAQPLGSLAVYFLEPRSMDGLTTWNFFDSALQEGRDHPVMRLLAPVELKTSRLPANFGRKDADH